MNVITHAILPALVATPLLPRGTRRGFYKAAAIVALGGVMPDLLHPHLSLAARYASWTHSVFALAGFALVLVAGRTFRPGWLPWRIVALTWAAFALHLFLDAVSGGIAFYQPVSSQVLAARPRWIPYKWWWWSDAGMVLAMLVLWPVLLRRTPWSEAAPAERARD